MAQDKAKAEAGYFQYIYCPECGEIIRGVADTYDVYKDIKGGKEAKLGGLGGSLVGYLLGMDPTTAKQIGKMAGMGLHAYNNAEYGTNLKVNFTCPHCGFSFSQEMTIENDTAPDMVLALQKDKLVAKRKRRNINIALIIIISVIVLLLFLPAKFIPEYKIVGEVQKKFIISWMSEVKEYNFIRQIADFINEIVVFIVPIFVVSYFIRRKSIRNISSMSLREYRKSSTRVKYENYFEKNENIFKGDNELFPPYIDDGHAINKARTWLQRNDKYIPYIVAICFLLSCTGIIPGKGPIDLRPKSTQAELALEQSENHKVSSITAEESIEQRTKNSLEERAIDIYMSLPDHEKVRSSAKQYLSMDLYNALVENWDLPEWTDGEIGLEKSSWFIKTGDDGETPRRRDLRVAKVTNIDETHREVLLLNQSVGEGSYHYENRLYLIKENGVWVLDELFNEAVEYLKESCRSEVKEELDAWNSGETMRTMLRKQTEEWNDGEWYTDAYIANVKREFEKFIKTYAK